MWDVLSSLFEGDQIQMSIRVLRKHLEEGERETYIHISIPVVILIVTLYACHASIEIGDEVTNKSWWPGGTFFNAGESK